MRRKKGEVDEKLDEVADSKKNIKDVKLLELRCHNLEKALLVNENLTAAEQMRYQEVEVSLRTKLAEYESNFSCVVNNMEKLLAYLQIDFPLAENIRLDRNVDRDDSNDMAFAEALLLSLHSVSSRIHDREVNWHSKIDDERRTMKDESQDVVRKCEKLEEVISDKDKTTQKIQYQNTEIRFKLQADIATGRRDLSDNRVEMTKHKSDNQKLKELVFKKNNVIRVQQEQLEKVSMFEECVFGDVTKLSLKFRRERNSDLNQLACIPKLESRIRSLEAENAMYKNQAKALRKTVQSLRLNVSLANDNRGHKLLQKEHQSSEKWKSEALELREMVRSSSNRPNHEVLSGNFDVYDDDDDNVSQSCPLSPAGSENDLSPDDRKLNRRRAASASQYFKKGLVASRNRLENYLQKTNRIHSGHDTSSRLLTEGDNGGSSEEIVFNSSRNLVVANRHKEDRKAKSQRLEASRMSIGGRQKDLIKELSHLDPLLSNWISMSSCSETAHLFDDEDRAILHKLGGTDRKT